MSVLELGVVAVIVGGTRSFWPANIRWGANALVVITMLAAVMVLISPPSFDQTNAVESAEPHGNMGIDLHVRQQASEKLEKERNVIMLAKTRQTEIDRDTARYRDRQRQREKLEKERNVIMLPTPTHIPTRIHTEVAIKATPQSPSTTRATAVESATDAPLPEEEKLRPSIGNFMVIQVLAYLPRGPVPNNLTMYYDPTVGQGSRWEPFWWKLKEDYAWVWSRIGIRVERWTKSTAYLNISATPERQQLFTWVKNVTLIHFRCSDAPFVRGSTHLQPREYWNFVAEQLVELGATTVVFTMCTNWLMDNMASHRCPVFLEQSRQFLINALPSSINVEPGFRCWGPRTTWNLLLQADILVSGLESSFSFIPGMTKGDRYISPKMQSTDRKRQERYPVGVDKMVPWRMYTGSSIYHNLVANYSTFDLSLFQFPKDFSETFA